MATGRHPLCGFLIERKAAGSRFGGFVYFGQELILAIPCFGVEAYQRE